MNVQKVLGPNSISTTILKKFSNSRSVPRSLVSQDTYPSKKEGSLTH